jgi:hypothetical protein
MLCINLKYIIPMTIRNFEFWYARMHVTILEKIEN